jgi:hypothetical protein
VAVRRQQAGVQSKIGTRSTKALGKYRLVPSIRAGAIPLSNTSPAADRTLTISFAKTMTKGSNANQQLIDNVERF